MKGYIDLFLLPLQKKNLAAYRKMAQKFSKVIQEYGALEYREFIGDDLENPNFTSYLSLIKLKPGEVLISSIVGFRSKAHRNQVNKCAMADPRMKVLCEQYPLFDMKKMYYGGFKTIVEMQPLKKAKSR